MKLFSVFFFCFCFCFQSLTIFFPRQFAQGISNISISLMNYNAMLLTAIQQVFPEISEEKNCDEVL